MAKPKSNPDPTKDSKFQKVVQTFLKTPPRQHKEDVGKAAEKPSRTGAPKKAKPTKPKQREPR